MAPRPTCSRNRPITVRKYLPVAFIEGVGFRVNSGSAVGTVGGASCLARACQKTRAATPKISSSTLATDHTMLAGLGTLSISGSCGQFEV
jgi:hypothetical protein